MCVVVVECDACLAQGSIKRHVTCVGERRDYVGSTDSGKAALRVKSSVGVYVGYKLVCTHLFVFEFDRRMNFKILHDVVANTAVPSPQPSIAALCM